MSCIALVGGGNRSNVVFFFRPSLQSTIAYTLPVPANQRMVVEARIVKKEEAGHLCETSCEV